MQRLINPDVIAKQDEFAARFLPRDPFRHVVIDDFLADGYATQLLDQFPPFEHGSARNEAGELGNKSTVEKIRHLGAAYSALDDLVQSSEFLDLIGRITGIDGLLYDPWYFGGGTHENRQGQDLDAHVDFNRHPVNRWHRRLNLIVYLNREWQDDWGGSLQLHSDPRSTDDRIITITPKFNRAVIFETTETSWHGFPRIALPEDRHALTRKSVALYFYTKDRPVEETGDMHSTIYVDAPLPARFAAGHTLDADDVEQLRHLLARRDKHNQRLYRDLTAMTAKFEEAQVALYGRRLGRLRYLAQVALRRWRQRA